MRAFVLVDVCVLKQCHCLMSAAKEVTGCRNWNPFFCLFLHFTQSVSSLWAELLKVHVASGIVCLRLFTQAGLDPLKLVSLDCSNRQLAAFHSCCAEIGVERLTKLYL
jgi:hypothetical protein